MSDKIREFFELVHSMNHGELRQIARAITDQIADKEGRSDFDVSDYRDFCDVLFDCASQAAGEEDVHETMNEALEPRDELPPRTFAEPDTGPVSAFARKGA